MAPRPADILGGVRRRRSPVRAQVTRTRVSAAHTWLQLTDEQGKVFWPMYKEYGAEMDAIKHGYEENRRILIEGLPKAGLDTFLPADGAFYLYADVSKFTSDSLDFTKKMLEEAHVAATSGVDFDLRRAARHRLLVERDVDDASGLVGCLVGLGRHRPAFSPGG